MNKQTIIIIAAIVLVIAILVLVFALTHKKAEKPRYDLTLEEILDKSVKLQFITHDVIVDSEGAPSFGSTGKNSGPSPDTAHNVEELQAGAVIYNESELQLKVADISPNQIGILIAKGQLEVNGVNLKANTTFTLDKGVSKKATLKGIGSNRIFTFIYNG